jgi:hypothetical protein
LTRSSGTWTSASDVLTPNDDDAEVAIHALPCSSPCSYSTGSKPADGGYASNTPEPRSMTLFGMGLLVMGFVLRRRNKEKRTA